jgi:hypothetical protein
MKCLLIETKDKRKFFTHKKNFIQLIEFSKTFDAEMSIVKIEKGTVLELEELAPAFCNPNYKKTNINYEKIKDKYIQEKKTRSEIVKIAEKIQNHIRNQFKRKDSVSLKKLRIKFKEYELSDAALCNHIRRTKADLENEGMKFIKISAGEYKAI